MNNGNVPLGVIAPAHGIESGVFPNDALDSYLGQVFSSGNSLTVTDNVRAGRWHPPYLLREHIRRSAGVLRGWHAKIPVLAAEH